MSTYPTEQRHGPAIHARIDAVLHLVRHGRPDPSPVVARHEWGLSSVAVSEVHRLRDSGVFPPAARWFSSFERRAVETARLLHDGDIVTRRDLREQERPEWVGDFEAAIERAVRHPDRPTRRGWETAAEVTRRVVGEVRSITGQSAGDVVLVGHGFAWTLLVAALTDREPDLASWRAMAMPDHCAVDGDRVVSPWGAWTTASA